MASSDLYESMNRLWSLRKALKKSGLPSEERQIAEAKAVELARTPEMPSKDIYWTGLVLARTTRDPAMLKTAHAMIRVGLRDMGPFETAVELTGLLQSKSARLHDLGVRETWLLPLRVTQRLLDRLHVAPTPSGVPQTDPARQLARENKAIKHADNTAKPD